MYMQQTPAPFVCGAGQSLNHTTCAHTQGTQSRTGTGYIEIPIPVPLLILRDPPGKNARRRSNAYSSVCVLVVCLHSTPIQPCALARTNA